MKYRIPNQPPLQWLCAQCQHKIRKNPPSIRFFTTSLYNNNNNNNNNNNAGKSPPKSSTALGSLSAMIRDQTMTPRTDEMASLSALISGGRRSPKAERDPIQTAQPTSDPYAVESGDPLDEIKGFRPANPPHCLHVYAHRHNTHITLADPKQNALISVSTGNIGFRKAARGTYDAAYQLGAYVMGRIVQKGYLRTIRHMELILRDFGAGRDAIEKILLGTEGRHIRGRIVRVRDATRLKFGGTRSPKARRLG